MRDALHGTGVSARRECDECGRTVNSGGPLAGCSGQAGETVSTESATAHTVEMAPVVEVPLDRQGVADVLAGEA